MKAVNFAASTSGKVARWVGGGLAVLVLLAVVAIVVFVYLAPALGYTYVEGRTGDALVNFGGSWVGDGKDCGAVAIVEAQGMRFLVENNQTLRDLARAHLSHFYWHETRGALLVWVFPCHGYVVDRVEVFS